MEQGQNTHSVTIERTRKDYFAFLRYVGRSLANLRTYYIVALIVLLVIYYNVIMMAFSNRWMPDVLMTQGYLSVAFFAILFIVLQLLLRMCFTPAIRREYLNDNQAFLRRKQAAIDERGYREFSEVSDAFVAWAGVDRIEKTRSFILIYVDRMSAFCIPLRNFATPAQAESFYENMRAYWHKANGRAAGV